MDLLLLKNINFKFWLPNDRKYSRNKLSLKRICTGYIQSTFDISDCQGTNKFVRDIESSSYRVVILCKLIRMGPIVLFETSRVRLIEYIEISRFDCISKLFILDSSTFHTSLDKVHKISKKYKQVRKKSILLVS